MTLRARRWYYSIAILVFLIAAPLVVGSAAGWRWNGWRQGFVQTGTILVTSRDKVTVELNGQKLGPTPKRLTGLAPGLYRLRLLRPGYQSWEHVVSVTSRTTTSIGPVALFPEQLQIEPVTNDVFTNFLVDQESGAIAGWNPTPTGATLRLLWPLITDQEIALTETPSWIRLSPRRQRLAIGLPTSSRILPLSEPTAGVVLATNDPVAWLPSSENIIYRLTGGQIIADDALTGTTTPIATANSMIIVEDGVWYTNQISDVTTIYQRSDATATSSRLITTLNGNWRLVGRIGRSVIAQEQTTGAATILTMNRLTGRLTQRPLGGYDRLLDGASEEAVLWLNGVDVLTLSPSDAPIVLLRSTEELLAARWLDNGHLLATLSETSLSIRSVSSRQGRGTLLTQAWPQASSPLLLDLKTSSVFMVSAGRLEKWRWK